MNSDEFLSFIDKCPTQFHFCAYTRSELLKFGFTELKEDQEWSEIPKKAFLFEMKEKLLHRMILDIKEQLLQVLIVIFLV